MRVMMVAVDQRGCPLFLHNNDYISDIIGKHNLTRIRQLGSVALTTFICVNHLQHATHVFLFPRPPPFFPPFPFPLPLLFGSRQKFYRFPNPAPHSSIDGHHHSFRHVFFHIPQIQALWRGWRY